MIKTFLFRLNAGSQYGLGHYFRTIAVANGLTKKGHHVILVHNVDPFWNSSQDGLEKISIHVDSSLLDEELIHKIILQKHVDSLVIDGNISYTKEFWDKLKRLNVRLVNYQNLSSSKNLCDVYILPSLHQKSDFFEDFYLEKTKIFQGLEYFTFNENIQTITPKDKIRSLQKIAITTGGSDPNNLTALLYQYCSNIPQFEFNIFLGENYLYREQVSSWKHYDHIRLREYDIQSILENDVLISAFGVSSYEFLALGMPIIAIGHQASNAAAADFLAKETSSIISLGEMSDLKLQSLKDLLLQLADKVELLNEMSERATKILDLNGLNRVINILENEQ